MVNDLTIIKKGLFLTSSLFILLLIPDFSFGQKISKYYVSYPKESSILYFIKAPGSWKNKNVHSSLNYDITYETTKDSLTFNFSYFDKNSLEPDSMVIKNENHIISNNVEKIFVDIKKKNFHYRYTSRFSFKDFKIFFDQGSNHVEMELITQDQKHIVLTISLGKWSKQRDIIHKILALISMNNPGS
jgi:hypothetical protein